MGINQHEALSLLKLEITKKPPEPEIEMASKSEIGPEPEMRSGRGLELS
jgi:hypothetical protein